MILLLSILQIFVAVVVAAAVVSAKVAGGLFVA